MPETKSHLPLILGAIGLFIIMETWANENAGGWLFGGFERYLTNWVVTPVVYPIPNHQYYFNLGFFVLHACGIGMIAKGGALSKLVGVAYIAIAWTKYITGYEFNFANIPGDFANAFGF